MEVSHLSILFTTRRAITLLLFLLRKINSNSGEREGDEYDIFVHYDIQYTDILLNTHIRNR